MKRKSGLSRLAVAFIGLLVLGITVSAQTSQLRLANDSVLATDGVLISNPPAVVGHLPVLFVHGHNPELLGHTELNDPGYKKDWVDPLGTMPSFRQTLAQNAGLGIEEYYLRFFNQARSITDDARDIRDTINLILERHDSGFDHTNPASTTNVKVVIVAYSKGTISTRVYLKSLCVNDSRCLSHEPVLGLDPPLQHDFRPVSEFIAISPPNHAITTNAFASTNKLSVHQLYNGTKPHAVFLGRITSQCTESFGDTAATNYIGTLNGHPMSDSLVIDATENYPQEAPGSRPRASPPSTPGTLYVTLFANDNSDMVGGLTPASECPTPDGRRLASNLSSDAANIHVSVSNQSTNPLIGPTLAVHENTVHTPLVICKALYAAVHHRSPELETCGLTDADDTTTVPIIPRLAAMLTLDFSGSMGAPAPPDPSRAVALQDAVALFTHLWMAVGVPGDRLGVTYFSSTVDQYHPLNSSETLLPLPTSGEDIIRNVRGQTPHDLTAMGGGLKQSIATLSSVDNYIRRIILFTDGMQNVNPLVEPGGATIAGTPPTVLNTLGIPIDTIGIGAGDSFLQLLRNISSTTNGRHMSTAEPGADLSQFFVESLINALKGFSPQLVAYRRGSVSSGGSSTQDFTIEDGPRKLVLEVSWKRGDSLDFSVAKDGVDVTGVGRFINGATHKIFVIDLPYKDITARGNWQLRINGRANTAYETAAIIDGERISYDAMFNVQRPRAGDALDLVVRLATAGQPIRGRVKVKVAWKSPRTTVGDVIAKYKPKDFPATEPGASAAERQILALAYDPEAWAAMKPKTQTEKLKSNDKGEYRKQFRPEIPGVYTAVVTIEGEDAKLGKFMRTLTTTTVVAFANPKLKDRDLSISETPSASRLRNVSVIVFPRDKDGHRMGPGLSSNISLTLAGRTVNGIQDLGDGRYLVVLAPSAGEDPMIRLEVAGATLFSGPLSKLPRK